VIALRVNAAKAGALAFSMAWCLTKTITGPDQTPEHWLSELSNGALNSLQVDTAPIADVSLTLARPVLEALLKQQLKPMEAITTGQLQLAGNVTLLATFFGLLDRFSGTFPVVDAAPWPV
jgi:alkyl sulfatase BDS1-like metallo-beta-lactamase superfamily hydrolase